MDNSGNYQVGFYFRLSFQGQDAAFQDVSGISRELQLEEIVCGGENRFKYKLPGVASSQNLVLKRAILPPGSQLVNWCSLCIDQGFGLAIQTHDVMLSLLNAKGEPSISWTFHNAYPVKYAVSELHAMENQIVIESVELAYTFFEISTDESINRLFI
ncbi:MAG: phage tail protein [Bacteroidetes bacterium]|nr:phage tail protein [Bacteroidota bacterium]